MHCRMKDFFMTGGQMYFNNMSSIMKVNDQVDIPADIMSSASDAFVPPSTIEAARRSPTKTRVDLQGKITKVNISIALNHTPNTKQNCFQLVNITFINIHYRLVQKYNAQQPMKTHF